MGATVQLNGKKLGDVTDQFLRYTFDISESIIDGDNTLEVIFDPAMKVAGRFMACTGGWDWAPYSWIKNSEGATIYSKGIWKSVYILTSSSIAITDVVPLTYYQGAYPVGKLEDKQTGDFLLKIILHFNALEEIKAKITLNGEWGGQASQDVTIK